MDESRRALPSLLFQVAVAGILCDCYLLLRIHEDISPFLLRFLLIFGPLVCGINRLYLRRSRPVAAVTALNVILWLLGSGFCLYCASFGGISEIVFAAACTGILTFLAMDLTVNPPKLNTMVLTLDFNIVLMLCYVGLCTYWEQDLTYLYPALLGLTAALLGLITIRIKRRVGPREIAFLLVILFALLLLMEILLATVAPTAGRGLIAAGNGLLAVLSVLLSLANRFLIFLTSLFPALSEEEMLPEVETTEEIESDMDYGNGAPLWLLFLIIAAFLIAAVIFFLRYCRGRRVSRRRTVSIQAAAPRRSLRESLRLLLARFRNFLRRRRFLRRNRNNPVGLFYLFERSCRHSPLARSPGETPREFLSRLAGSFPEEPETADRLAGLLPLVDAAFYSRTPERPAVPGAPALRRRVKRAALRSRLQRHRQSA